MPKLALFLSAFFLLILFQQSSYGFIEGSEVPMLSNFDIERTSDIITMDLSPQENLAKRYLVYGSGSLNSAFTDSKNIAYGIIDTANKNVLSMEPNFSINLKNKSFISLFLFKNN